MAKKKKVKKTASGPSKFVIFIGDEGAVLVHLRGNVVVRRMYAPSPEDDYTGGFKEYLAKDTEAPIQLLVDVIDQTYTTQTLPPVTKLSVGKLIKRRLERDFAPEDITGAIPLGRKKEGRKDWNYLLIALSPTPHLNQWIQLFSELPNRMGGIFLAPVEAEYFIQDISTGISKRHKGETPEWQILVSHNKVGGFRQIVIQDGQLVFTRLAQPIGDSVAEVVAGSIEQEILNTIEYLKRLGYNEDTPLELIVIVAEEIKNAIDSSHFNITRTSILTPYEVNDLLELNKAALPEDHYGDVVMAAYFGQRTKHKLRLQTEQMRQLMQFQLYDNLLRYGAGAIAASLIFFSGYTAYETYPLLGEVSSMEHKISSINKKISELKENSKELPDNIDRITDVVSVYESYANQKFSPLNDIAKFSVAMEDDVLVRSFNWSKSNTLPETDATAEKAEKIDMQMDIEFRMRNGHMDSFLTHANNFLERVRTTFDSYIVENSKLPGTLGENETFQATFGSNTKTASSNMLSGDPVVVQLSISGPNSGTTP